jgi:hypothetical protein
MAKIERNYHKIMNLTKFVLGITIAVFVGMIGVNSSLLQLQCSAEKLSNSDSGIKILGHVTNVVTDSDGKIKAYRQTDNVVVNSGKNCVSKLLFGGPSSSRGAAGSGVCIGANTAPWNVIGIGNDTAATVITPAQNDFTLQKESTTSGNSFNTRTVGSISWASGNQTGGSGSSTVKISSTFGPVSGIRSAGLYVVSSGLFNNTNQASPAAGGMFAEQAISPILINNGDSITVSWTINVG